MAKRQLSKPVSSIPKYLRCREICERLNLSDSGLRGMIAAGHFPQPVRLGPRSLGFPEDAVLAWVASRPTAAAGAE